MRTHFFLVPLLAIFFLSCNEKENVSIKEDVLKEEAIIENVAKDVDKIIKFLYTREFANFEDALLYSEINFVPGTRTPRDPESILISDEALNTIDKMRNMQVPDGMTLDAYKSELLRILNLSFLDIHSGEYIALVDAIDATVAVIQLKSDLEVTTKGLLGILKCVGGTLGSVGLGALAGAAVGTITLPVVGTVSGAAVGAISGALVGAAEFC